MAGRLKGLILAAVLFAAYAPRAHSAIVINEIHYNSPGPLDIEFVELFNAGTTAQTVDGWYLLDDDNAHDRCFLVGTIDPGEYLVVPGRTDLFGPTYPGVGPLNPNSFDDPSGQTGFSLGNTSDSVRLFDSGDNLVDRVDYQDSGPWPNDADGDGSSLELINPTLDNNDPANWDASDSSSPPGTPGAQNSVFIANPEPVLSNLKRDVDLPRATDSVTVTVEATDDSSGLVVELVLDTGSGFSIATMLDDGLSGDGQAGDSVYGTVIAAQPSGTLVRYYARATDSQLQQVLLPENAPAELNAYTVDYTPPTLWINEFLASNQNGITDSLGENDDWLEIYNPGPDLIQLGGMYLTDEKDDPTQWELPAVSLEPGGFLLVWCDDDLQTGLHANFTLSRDGGFVGLFDTEEHGNVQIHGIEFGPQNTDVSYGFAPSGRDSLEYLAPPTPNAANGSVFSAICINEIFAASQVGLPDWIELYNRGNVTVTMNEWFLSDDAATPARFEIPFGTSLAPGSHIAFDENTLGFALSADGSEVVLLTDDVGDAHDYFDYPPQLANLSQGRVPDGTANWHFLGIPSRDLSNACPAGVPPLPRVENVRFGSRFALEWDSLNPAESYDLLVGDLDQLASGGSLGAAITGCASNNQTDTVAWIDPQIVGNALFYLVRGVDGACGFGTYDSGGASQSASRDGEVAASPQRCP